MAKAKKILCLLVVLAVSFCVFSFSFPKSYAQTNVAQGLQVNYRTKAEIQAFVRQNGATVSDTEQMEQTPSTTAPYQVGSATNKTLQSGVAMVNQVRYVAGINANVKLDSSYTQKAQAGAFLNSVNGELSHTPVRPSSMDNSLYNLGYSGAGSSNLAVGYGNLNRTIIFGWMDDSGVQGLGHRNWILNPKMSKTGFGISGRYKSMYVFDDNGSGSQKGVAWPAQNMPVEYFSQKTPWSINMGYDVGSSVTVTLTKASTNQKWVLSQNTTANGSLFTSDNLIYFYPKDLSYKKGDVFHVSISGLTSPVSYSVEFFSLSDQLVTVSNQPKSATYILNSVASPLTVKAAGEANFSYQWYWNTKQTVVGAKLLKNATKNSFSPFTNKPGTYYYFAKIKHNGSIVNSSFAKIIIKDQLSFFNMIAPQKALFFPTYLIPKSVHSYTMPIRFFTNQYARKGHPMLAFSTQNKESTIMMKTTNVTHSFLDRFLRW